MGYPHASLLTRTQYLLQDSVPYPPATAGEKYSVHNRAIALSAHDSQASEEAREDAKTVKYGSCTWGADSKGYPWLSLAERDSPRFCPALPEKALSRHPHRHHLHLPSNSNTTPVTGVIINHIMTPRTWKAKLRIICTVDFTTPTPRKTAQDKYTTITHTTTG